MGGKRVLPVADAAAVAAAEEMTHRRTVEVMRRRNRKVNKRR